MTRKARRKLLSPRATQVRRKPIAPWLAVLAGAALGHAPPASAAPSDLGDPRLHLIHEALESSRFARLRLGSTRTIAAQEQAAAQQLRTLPFQWDR